MSSLEAALRDAVDGDHFICSAEDNAFLARKETSLSEPGEDWIYYNKLLGRDVRCYDTTLLHLFEKTKWVVM